MIPYTDQKVLAPLCLTFYIILWLIREPRTTAQLISSSSFAEWALWKDERFQVPWLVDRFTRDFFRWKWGDPNCLPSLFLLNHCFWHTDFQTKSNGENHSYWPHPQLFQGRNFPPKLRLLNTSWLPRPGHTWIAGAAWEVGSHQTIGNFVARNGVRIEN